jgi:uncharacterized protein (UPF0264 family)
MTVRLLVSVRSVDEARVAAQGGADFIDLKEPGRGALGDLPVQTIRAVVQALREPGAAGRATISATIGDVAMADLATIAQRVEAVGDCGVDIVKVGIEAGDPAAASVLSWLAGCGRSIVPVFIADRGIDLTMVRAAARLGFTGLMADTADKKAGSLLDLVDDDTLRRFVATAREEGVMVGLAGALRREQAARIVALGPDFAGFRSAVCEGDRSGTIDAARLRALRDAFDTAALRP